MKHLKLYNNEPEVGYYVLMSSQSTPELKKIIENTIGKITKIDYNSSRSRDDIWVEYNFSPDILLNYNMDNKRLFSRFQIVSFGKTEQEVRRKKEYKKFSL